MVCRSGRRDTARWRRVEHMGRDAERRRRNWAHGGRSGSRAARPDRREPCGESRRHPGADRSPSTRPYGADRPRRGPGRPGGKPALRNFPLSPSAAPMPLRPTERRPACRPLPLASPTRDVAGRTRAMAPTPRGGAMTRPATRGKWMRTSTRMRSRTSCARDGSGPYWSIPSDLTGAASRSSSAMPDSHETLGRNP